MATRRQRVQRWCSRCIYSFVWVCNIYGVAGIIRHSRFGFVGDEAMEGRSAAEGVTPVLNEDEKNPLNRNRSLTIHRCAVLQVCAKRATCPTTPCSTNVSPIHNHTRAIRLPRKKEISTFKIVFISALPHPHHRRLPRHPNQHRPPTSRPASALPQAH